MWWYYFQNEGTLLENKNVGFAGLVNSFTSEKMTSLLQPKPLPTDHAKKMLQMTLQQLSQDRWMDK